MYTTQQNAARKDYLYNVQYLLLILPFINFSLLILSKLSINNDGTMILNYLAKNNI
jgi:hypothetical protein